jgi:tryptophan synthase beta chain
MTESVKYPLDESRMPKSWYNLMADLPAPPPPVLHPGTLQPDRSRRSGAAVSAGR